MNSHVDFHVVCPACTERFAVEAESAETDPSDDYEVECPCCGWEFSGYDDCVDDESDIDGESELEVDADGETIDPEDGQSFSPWHGLVSVLRAQERRGWYDSGERDESSDDDWIEDVHNNYLLRRGRCPSCAHAFRNVDRLQLLCPDCHFTFSMDSEVWRLDRELSEEEDEGYRQADGRLDDADLPPIIVCPRGTGHVRDVSAALARANNGRTILLRPGFYSAWDRTDAAVQVVGDGPRDEIVVHLERQPLTLDHPQSVLRNLTLRGLGRRNKRKHPALDLLAGTVEDCAISSDTEAGVRMQGGVLRRCQVHDCEQVGILSRGGVIEECEATHNGAAGLVIDRNSCDVLRTRIGDNYGPGIRIDREGSAWLRDSTIDHNAKHGIAIAGWRARLLRCAIHDNGSAGVCIEPSGSAELRRCDVFGNVRSGLINQGGGLHMFGSRIRDGHGAGIVVRDTAVTSLRRCVICRNHRAALMRSRGSGKPVLRHCRVFANGASDRGVTKPPEFGGQRST
jgi:Right handed beta helix region